MAALDIDTRDTAEPEDTVVHLWPETALAWVCWQGVRTQWMVGMGGATGLFYPGVDVVLDRHRLRGRKRGEIFDCIQAAEQEALAVWSEQRDIKKQQQQQPQPAR